ncbi:nitrilase and fragile histidine triad fusion protein NitFhit [Culicoides brevitarsis]|uniref:nitrilase and fragile histidine triad fusion protein NitFhit n=1 Tax=Culicoides brevitarsis TaxID=469753 RepID=UPI00307CC64B
MQITRKVLHFLNLPHKYSHVNKLNVILRRKMTTNNDRIVAVASMLSTSDKKHNLTQIESIIDKAKKGNAKFVFFPECCDYVGENRYQTIELAESFDGPMVQKYKELAEKNNLFLSFGGIHEAIFDEKGEKTNRVHNTHILIDPSGKIIGKYRKLHMFNVDTPEFKYRESEIAKPGQQITPPIATPIGNVGLQICYDLRFPEVSTFLRKQGASILTYPSAFSVSTGKAHWEVLLRSRAIENQCYVIAAAQNGAHNKKRSSYGHALIVDPWGKVVAECDQETVPDVAFAEIDPNKLESVRNNMPCFEHRRDDIYAIKSVTGSTEIQKDFMFGPHKVPKETIFYESAHSVAFTNIRCVVPGHVLVASKSAKKLLGDLTPEEAADFFETVTKVEKVSLKVHETASSTVNVQNGEFSGQTVAHVHCHILPRRKGDFEFNDEIYIELAKHDDPKRELEARRSLEEMTAEATLLRQVFQEMYEL